MSIKTEVELSAPNHQLGRNVGLLLAVLVIWIVTFWPTFSYNFV